jgi:hypothetical protein
VFGVYTCKDWLGASIIELPLLLLGPVEAFDPFGKGGGWAIPIPLPFPITGGDENCFTPEAGVLFLLRYCLKVIAPPPALLIFPYFLVVFTNKVK